MGNSMSIITIVIIVFIVILVFFFIGLFQSFVNIADDYEDKKRTLYLEESKKL